MSATAFLANCDTGSWNNPLCFPRSVFPRLAQVDRDIVPTAESIEATLTHDERFEILCAWTGLGKRDPIVAEIFAGGITTTTDIARELLVRARRELAERKARRVEATKGNTGLSDSQDFQTPKDSQDSHRLSSQPGDRSTDSRREGDSLKGEEEDPQRKHSRDVAKWWAEFIKRPLADFVARAWEHDYQRKGTDDWQEWQGAIFYFAWLLRGHPNLQPYLSKPAAGVVEVEKIMSTWTRSCRASGKTPHYGFHSGDVWAEWFDIDKIDARAEFIDCWQRARFTPGQGPLEQAHAAARQMRLLLPDEVAHKRPRGDGKRDESDYEFFVSVAGHLQVVVGDADITLPCHNLADLLKVSTRTIARYRRWGVADGFLRVTKEHKLVHPKSANNVATQFRFNVSRYKVLGEKAQIGTAEGFSSVASASSRPRE